MQRRDEERTTKPAPAPTTAQRSDRNGDERERGTALPPPIRDRLPRISKT
jgi:hypothetical protein